MVKTSNLIREILYSKSSTTAITGGNSNISNIFLVDSCDKDGRLFWNIPPNLTESKLQKKLNNVMTYTT